MPALLPNWGATGTIVAPDATKISVGWVLGEKPPHEYMNWWQNLFAARVNHVLTYGVAEWDSSIAYPVGAFTGQNGAIYRALTTSTNKAPSTNPSNWRRVTEDASSLTLGTVPNARISGSYTGFVNITASGAVSAGSFIGAGGGITGLNAANLASGTVPSARMNGSYTAIVNLTASGRVTAGSFEGNGASITSLNASQLVAGTVPNARLNGNYSFDSLTLTGGLNVAGSGAVATNFGVGGIMYVADGGYFRAPPNGGTALYTFQGDVGTGIGRAGANTVSIYIDGVEQFRVGSSGIVSSQGTGYFSGPAQGLTNLNGSNIDRGTVAAARLPVDAAERNRFSDVLTLMGAFSVGTRTLLMCPWNITWNPGAVLAGSNLRYVEMSYNNSTDKEKVWLTSPANSTAPGGSWMNCGAAHPHNQDTNDWGIRTAQRQL